MRVMLCSPLHAVDAVQLSTMQLNGVRKHPLAGKHGRSRSFNSRRRLERERRRIALRRANAAAAGESMLEASAMASEPFVTEESHIEDSAASVKVCVTW